jgi:hypothetical protein
MTRVVFWWAVSWSLAPLYWVGRPRWYGWATGKYARASCDVAMVRWRL